MARLQRHGPQLIPLHFPFQQRAGAGGGVSFVGAQISQVASDQFLSTTAHTGLPPAPTSLERHGVSSTEIDLLVEPRQPPTYSQVYVYRSTNGGAYELIAVLRPSATSL